MPIAVSPGMQPNELNAIRTNLLNHYRAGLPPVHAETLADRNARNLAIVRTLDAHDYDRDATIVAATEIGIVVRYADRSTTLSTVTEALNWLGY